MDFLFCVVTAGPIDLD